MEQPGGFQSSRTAPLVCRLRKALYALKQAPHAWFHRLSIFLHSLGFVTCKVDSSLLVCHTNTHYCYVLVYVYDNFITDNSSLIGFLTHIDCSWSVCIDGLRFIELFS